MLSVGSLWNFFSKRSWSSPTPPQDKPLRNAHLTWHLWPKNAELQEHSSICRSVLRDQNLGTSGIPPLVPGLCAHSREARRRQHGNGKTLILYSSSSSREHGCASFSTWVTRGLTPSMISNKDFTPEIHKLPFPPSLPLAIRRLFNTCG